MSFNDDIGDDVDNGVVDDDNVEVSKTANGVHLLLLDMNAVVAMDIIPWISNNMNNILQKTKKKVKDKSVFPPWSFIAPGVKAGAAVIRMVRRYDDIFLEILMIMVILIIIITMMSNVS